VLGAEGRRRQEDRERARRGFDEDIPVRQRAVKQLLRVALVDVQVTEARGPEETAVRYRTRGQVNRSRDQRGA